MTKGASDVPADFTEELRWLVRLRWLVALLVMAGAAGGVLWGSWSARVGWVLVIGAVLFAYNVVFLLLSRRPSRGPLLVWVQIVVDLCCLTTLVFLTGGLHSPLLSFYVLPLVFIGLMLPPAASYIGAGASLMMVLIGTALTGQWPIVQNEQPLLLGWMLLVLLTSLLTNHLARSRRQREKILHRQTGDTRAILETAADAIITIDEFGIIESVNPAAERLFGYGRAEMIGRNVAMLMPEPDRSRHDAYLQRYMRTGEARIIGIGRTVIGRRGDGTSFPLELAVSEVQLDKRRRFTGILRDISERRDYERKVTSLNETLRRQQVALIQSEKMAALGQMAAGVAHEIANPLASMDSLLQLISRRPERLNGQTVEKLRDQASRISGIVHQLTSFAHPSDTGWEEVELNGLVEQTLEMLRFDRRLRSVQVVRNLSPDVGRLWMIPRAIQQVLVNLIMNAVDAMEGIDQPRLEIRTSAVGDELCIEVADNGTGIAPENLSRIAEPFFTTKPVGKGTGLGLSISFRLVERHGGRCEVQSTPGQGSRFLIHLPRSCERESPPPIIPNSESAGGE